MNKPYLTKYVTERRRLYNPHYGDDRICVCGHPYYRHFDLCEEEEFQDAGCKYCLCSTFKDRAETSGYWKDCWMCHGSGTIYLWSVVDDGSDPCDICEGSGKLWKEKE